MSAKHTAVSILWLIFLFPTLKVQAQEREPTAEELAALIATIEQVQSTIESRRSERASVFTELQNTEQSLASLAQEVSDLEVSIRRNEAELSTLQQERNRLLALKTAQQNTLGQYIRSSYLSGRQEYLKLLLNQENPSRASRTFRYYQYFFAARNEKVQELSTTITDLENVERQVSATNNKLSEQQSALVRQTDNLTEQIAQRNSVLEELDLLLASSARRLESLQADREEMERLIEEIQRSIASLSLEGQQESFENLRGRLIWPVRGDVVNSWGSSYGLGDLSWQGITIAASGGQQVQAVHHGRVVFADWFASSGLLLIIDHGGGYMSLYAHNQALFKEVGEWVNSGEVIAAVGNTGGQEEYGLYFEIRHDGESINPTRWFMAQQ